MTAANRLLEKILSAGDVIWQDAAGRTKLLVTLDAADLETLTAFRKQTTAPEDAGDERSYRVQPVSVYWLDAA
jgi:hypothetical protein